RFKEAEIVWCQEEPRNQGGWVFVDIFLEWVLNQIGAKHRRARYAGRPASASTAVGQLSQHQAQLKNYLEEPLGERRRRRARLYAGAFTSVTAKATQGPHGHDMRISKGLPWRRFAYLPSASRWPKPRSANGSRRRAMWSPLTNRWLSWKPTRSPSRCRRR